MINVSGKENETKRDKQLKRMKQRAEAKRDKDAEEVIRKAKKAPAKSPSHETEHEFH